LRSSGASRCQLSAFSSLDIAAAVALAFLAVKVMRAAGWPGWCNDRDRENRVEELGLTGSSQARVEAAQAKTNDIELTEQEKRDNVIRLAFGGSAERFDEFITTVRDAIPPNTGVVLRGSAVTGRRWKDGALFDAEGPGTSDLDLTLVGDEVIGFYKVTGFFLPGIHSRPISKDDPDIAPELTPLREQLMAMVQRPVNVQATRDFVMYVRGELLGQPYLVLIDKSSDTSPQET
jgi:hypothetical protein